MSELANLRGRVRHEALIDRDEAFAHRIRDGRLSLTRASSSSHRAHINEFRPLFFDRHSHHLLCCVQQAARSKRPGAAAADGKHLIYIARSARWRRQRLPKGIPAPTDSLRYGLASRIFNISDLPCKALLCRTTQPVALQSACSGDAELG